MDGDPPADGVEQPEGAVAAAAETARAHGADLRERLGAAVHRAETHQPRRKRSGGRGITPMGVLLAGLLVVAAIGALAMVTGAVDITGDRGDLLQGDIDKSYGYYHDREFDTQAQAPRWDTATGTQYADQDPVGETSRWVYDGPWEYGPYGSDGVARRQAGETTDGALGVGVGGQQLPDVFDTYTDADPSGGAPIGQVPSHWTSPYYDPYAGYSNPYANRIRMAWGEGYGPGAMTVDP